MIFDKAYSELLKGKKIRRKEWESLMHMRLIDGKVKTYKGEHSNYYATADILISTGWRIVDGDGKDLTFLEAIQELKNKKCLTNTLWLDDKCQKFIFIDNEQIAICKEVEFDFMPTYKCLCATDWEILK